MAAFDFRERLGDKIVVEEINLAVSSDKEAAIAPTRKLRDEIVGRGELYIHVELIF